MLFGRNTCLGRILSLLSFQIFVYCLIFYNILVRIYMENSSAFQDKKLRQEINKKCKKKQYPWKPLTLRVIIFM